MGVLKHVPDRLSLCSVQRLIHPDDRTEAGNTTGEHIYVQRLGVGHGLSTGSRDRGNDLHSHSYRLGKYIKSGAAPARSLPKAHW